MKLTDAIRWASERTEPAGATLYDRKDGVEYTCALGAVHYTLRRRGFTNVEAVTLHELMNELKRHYPALTEIVQLTEEESEENNCPTMLRLHALILTLNDDQSWNRPEIADFVDELVDRTEKPIDLTRRDPVNEPVTV